MAGPMQMIVIGFERTDQFRGDIIRELERLGNKGVIRVIDLQFVMKDETGGIKALEGSPLPEAEKIEFGAVIGGLLGLGAGGPEGAIEGAAAGALAVAEKDYGLTWSDVEDIAAQLEPGTAVAVMLFEHTWATGFSDAVRQAGGRMLAQGFLTPEAMFMVGAELQAIVDARETIELAQAAEAVALLDALETVLEAEIIEQAAIEEAAEVVMAAEAVKAAAAADAVRALIVADVIEEAAAERALNALVAANLIEAASLEAAEDAAAQAES